MQSFIITFITWLFCAAGLQAQEFTKHPNGFIYDEVTMGSLRHIVDSLNLKYKQCDLHKTYYSEMQVLAHRIRLDNAPAKAIKDISSQMPFDSFIARYPQVTITRNVVLTRQKYTRYDDTEVTELVGINLSTGSIYSYDITKEKSPGKHRWVYRDYENNLDAVWLTEEPASKPMDFSYARLVQYADCLIDTNHQVFIQHKKGSQYNRYKQPEGALKKFYDEIDAYAPQPVRPKKPTEKESEEYWKAYEKWEDAREKWVISTFSKAPGYGKKLDEAVAYAIKNDASDGRLEQYCYISGRHAEALELKRRRKVMGMCSMDDSPRRHAQEIAALAAVSVNWDIFLRSHLDIMNDRFSRMSDGSYAQGSRATYIAELEALDINVTDLLLGITLRVANGAPNHYFGSITRLGRALAETKNKPEFEQKIMGMIADPALDDYNRIVLYYLLNNYAYNQKEQKEKERTFKQLQTARHSLPVHIAGLLPKEKADEE